MKASSRKGAGSKVAEKALPRKSAKVRPPNGPIWQWSALATAAAIRSGAISAIEVVEVHVERMRAVNPKLNAIVVDLSEEALRAAKAADRAKAKGSNSACCTACRSPSRKTLTTREGPTPTAYQRK
jgi:amidase